MTNSSVCVQLLLLVPRVPAYHIYDPFRSGSVDQSGTTNRQAYSRDILRFLEHALYEILKKEGQRSEERKDKNGKAFLHTIDESIRAENHLDHLTASSKDMAP